MFIFCFRSVGCILYTLLVGKPPFETQTLKDTYARIKKNEYHIPSRVGPLAKKLISKLLQVIICKLSGFPMGYKSGSPTIYFSLNLVLFIQWSMFGWAKAFC